MSSWNRFALLGGLVTLVASTILAGCAAEVAGDADADADEGDLGSAQSALNVADVWTVVHGGTGQVVLSSDGTYTSTCQPLASFPLAVCPAPTGTWASPYSSVYVTFTGASGTSVSYRAGGPATKPTSLTQIASYYNGLIMDRGPSFQCSEFYDSAYAFERGPIAYACHSGHACLLGSNEDIGSANASNYHFVAETAAGYFVDGHCP